MAKTFYTERDIEDLARQGVKSLEDNENLVLTDLARDKARKLGIALIKAGEGNGPSAAKKANVSASATKSLPKLPPASTGSTAELEDRVHAAVKARLGDQVDNALLRTIVKRVIKSIKDK
jgi:hypothetical protein